MSHWVDIGCSLPPLHVLADHHPSGNREMANHHAMCTHPSHWHLAHLSTMPAESDWSPALAENSRPHCGLRLALQGNIKPLLTEILSEQCSNHGDENVPCSIHTNILYNRASDRQYKTMALQNSPHHDLYTVIPPINAPWAEAWFQGYRGHFQLSVAFYGMKIRLFLAKIWSKTWKMAVSGWAISGGGDYWRWAFIGGITVNRIIRDQQHSDHT